MKNLLLVSDLDGTLLTSSQQISEENIQAIRKFEDQGGLFTIATGRTEQAVASYIMQLNLTTPLILYNGAKIYCPVTQKVLFERNMVIPEEFWAFALSKASEDWAMLVYRDGEVYAPWRNALLEYHERKDGVVCSDLPEDTQDQAVTKLLLIARNSSDLISIEKKAGEIGFPAEIVYSEHNYLEILPYGVSKGTSLIELLKLLPNKELFTIAVGDNLNDLAIIREADHSFAVENAHPTLKTHATSLTVHHENHAIADIINGIMNNNELLA
ncbi:Cof-type HAD-IIB family hydrolase [Paenibacillus chibensis]|uniref:Cof-type HAD-IIB family hydrolase n=1 Tax=Paenibacillus chibensis TaxID=59846 RepID=A0ABU6PRU9_9BACL|nr:Cof-type HAD-IIB family hydrolase [Paenibacillus chibensis]